MDIELTLESFRRRFVGKNVQGAGQAGVVNHDVNPTKSIESCIDKCPCVRVVSYPADCHCRATTIRGNVGRNGLCSLHGLRQFIQHDLRATLSQPQCVAFAQAIARACDDGNAAIEVKSAHCHLPVFVQSRWAIGIIVN
jgi:hypothetical protein